ncbi:MAG: hypothetical protein J6W40_01860 [Alphaproteobacteria bacterium]|nr:hypothetical protein [Alphaproteobacteria bacterium]
MYFNRRIFSDSMAQRGGMLVELLMSVAIVAVVLPFLFRYQEDSIMRVENIAVARQMQDVQGALERYIVMNRDKLLIVAGKSITRVDIKDLSEYGIPEAIVEEDADRYQLRILKSSDATGKATLQGVVILNDDTISPMRTREIVAVGGSDMGFVEGTHAYGTFGAWHADTIDLGVEATNGIVGTTAVNRDNALYLWRIPSEDSSDATMLSGLSLGGHDVINVSNLSAKAAGFDETLQSISVAADKVVFTNRTTIDSAFETKNATCVGSLSSDAKTMEIAGALTLSDLGKFSNFNTNNLWVTKLELSGISIADTSKVTILDINQALDMTGGRINAMFTTVSFTGSITPRLVVRNRIEDSVQSAFFWDLKNNTANLADLSLVELNRMATLIAKKEGDSSTIASQVFGAVASNKNATAADFMNAINEIQTKVRAKYRLLNLE